MYRCTGLEKRSLKGQLTILFNILRTLNEKNGLSISEIADEIGIQHRTASHYAKLLYELGLADLEQAGPRLIVKINEKGKCIIKCLSEA